jgi:hypothetical protein
MSDEFRNDFGSGAAYPEDRTGSNTPAVGEFPEEEGSTGEADFSHDNATVGSEEPMRQVRSEDDQSSDFD